MITIREVQPEDAARLLDIFSYYVTNTAVSFEWQVPELEEFTRRIATITERYPYLVAQDNDTGIIQGFACAHSFVNRMAYDWSTELTIYLAPDARRQGTGRMLYQALEQRLKAMGLLNMYACIATPTEQSETLKYCSFDSVNFHQKMGFTLVGTFKQCGYKFGHFFDMVYMQKLIGSHSPGSAPYLPWHQSPSVRP